MTQPIELNQNKSVVTVGRGQQNDLVVQRKLVSRFHARIEYRRGKFILLDQSTNGTFVITQEGGKVYLHRKNYSCGGQG